MKVNKIPEKIYVTIMQPVSGKYTEMVAFEHGDGIEYIRKDTLIEKAEEFIKERFSFEDSWHVEGETSIMDKVIEDFKNYVIG